MKLYIFKTNIRNRKKIRHAKSLLKKHLSIKNWSVDLEDVDKVMRIEVTNDILENDIISMMRNNAFSCEVLSD